MKLSSRNRSTFAAFFFLGFLIGSLSWEIFEKILNIIGVNLSLGIGPVGFDLSVIAVHIVVNPGSILGILGGFLLFKYT